MAFKPNTLIRSDNLPDDWEDLPLVVDAVNDYAWRVTNRLNDATLERRNAGKECG